MSCYSTVLEIADYPAYLILDPIKQVQNTAALDT
jgi:hypothetical protein